MKVKADIISGFLGAGKTTLIKKLIEKKSLGEKLVVIENEFGTVGIDGGVLKESSVEVKEINSGCICCSLEGEFEKAVEEVCFKYMPDRIIIEPSGVGKLSDVLKACTAARLMDIVSVNMAVTVVDALKYQLYILNFGEFYKNQIESAKTIILSRTQKIDEKKLLCVTDSILRFNRNANIITTPWDDLNAEMIVSAAEKDISLSLENQLKSEMAATHPPHHKGCKCGCQDGHEHNHHADEVFDAWGGETPRRFDEQELQGILHELENVSTCGAVLRGKGILQTTQGNWVQFDYVPGEVRLKNAGADYTGRICIIGSHLNKSKIAGLFGIMA